MIRLKRKLFGPTLALLFIFILFIFQPPFLLNLKTTFVEILKLPLKLVFYPLQEVKLILLYRKHYREKFDLQEEVDLLKQENISLKEFSKENDRLRKLLDFKRKSPFTTVAARVIGRDSANWISALMIDKGRRDNLKVGMSVIGEAGLVGKIVEVGRSTSKALLINDPNLKVAALIHGSRDEGVISGALQGICRMYFVSLESEVEVDDMVITSGLGGIFPKGLLIGRVIDVDVDPSGLMKSCLIQPAASLSRLEEVLIIVK